MLATGHIGHHLSLATLSIRPAGEWSFESAEWSFVRVTQGFGYLFQKSKPCDLTQGQIVLLRGPGPVTIRASQLGPMTLAGYSIKLGQLHGYLTASELRQLEKLAADHQLHTRHYASDHEISRLFAELWEAQNDYPAIGLRARMLEVFSLAISEDLAGPISLDLPHPSARARFENLMKELPEAELHLQSTQSLARRCGCSERHFSRLFSEFFGRSFRAKQIELRLSRAQQLLRDSDAKIIDVAYESGYRHLGLFNLVFKQRFGLTPTQWRHKHRKRQPRAVTHAVFPIALSFLFAWTAAQLTMATALFGADAPPSPTFEVRGYEVLGNSLLPQSTLDIIFQDHVGPAVGMESVRQALGELQLAYRGRGFATVSVTLPQQTLTNGVVKIQVTEGRLAEILVLGQRHYSSNNVRRALSGLRTNLLLNSLVFQQELDRANANRDRQIYPQLGPGPEPGTSTLTLKVKDRLPLHARAELNNASTPGTPDLRFNTAVQYNNLWQYDHQIGLQYGFSPEKYKAADHLPWRFFDQPSVANYSVFYRAPLGGDAVPRDYTVGEFGFDEVSKRFKAPALPGRSEWVAYASRSTIDSGILRYSNFSTNTGTSNFSDETYQQNLTANLNAGFRLVQPLRLGENMSSLSLGLDFKQYSLRHFETNVISDIPIPPPPPAQAPPPTIIRNAVPLDQPVRHEVNYLPITVAWDLLRPDRRGLTSFSLNQSFYVGGLLDGNKAFADAGYTSDVGANYYVLNASLARDQKLGKDWVFRVRADGQWASSPLLSNEQYGIGGLAGVRGYREGQDYGDTGWRTAWEIHPPPMDIGLVDGTMPMFLRPQIFTDYGERYLLHDSPSRAGRESFWGTGFAINATIGERVDLRSYFSWALKDAAGVRAGHFQLGFNLAAQF